MSQRLREKDLQRLALKLADAMREEQGRATKHPRPSSGGSDAVGRPPIDNARFQKGFSAAIRAFHHAYIDTDVDTAPRDPAGQHEKRMDEDEEVGDAGTGDGSMGGIGGSRQQPGDTMAAEDEEYDDEWADYDGEDPDEEAAANTRNHKPNTKRFAQARNDQAAFAAFGKKKTDTLRAAYKCAKCGESNVVRKYAVAESNKANALRQVNAKCRHCGSGNVVAAPRGHAYVTEAVAIFSARYKREAGSGGGPSIPV